MFIDPLDPAAENVRGAHRIAREVARHRIREKPHRYAVVVEGVVEQVRLRDRHPRVIVCTGHIHNYERREQQRVLYLVSGGGGARPVPVIRDPADAYQYPGFPNFHYVRFTLNGERLLGEMFRLEDFDAAVPHSFILKGAFELRANPR